MVKKIFLIIIAALLLLGFYTYTVKKPSNNRNWEVGYERPATVSVNNNTVTIRNFRNIRDKSSHVYYTYSPRTVNANDIEKAWFVFEPFKADYIPTFLTLVAHTYFIFDVKDGPPLAVSVEARREKGEKYSVQAGLFNNFELIHVWSTDEDALIQRSILRRERQYMFPLQITQKQARTLFLQMAKDSQELESTPRFYNTFLSNCTNELSKSVNRIKKGTIPFTIASVFPGYSDVELYKLGFIPHDKPFAQIQEKYYINPKLQEIYKDDDFSRKLRDYLK